MAFNNFFNVSASFSTSSSSSQNEETSPSFTKNSLFSNSFGIGGNNVAETAFQQIQGFGRSMEKIMKESHKVDKSYHLELQQGVGSPCHTANPCNLQPQTNPHYNNSSGYFQGNFNQTQLMNPPISPHHNNTGCFSHGSFNQQHQMQPPYPQYQPGYPPMQPAYLSTQPGCYENYAGNNNKNLVSEQQFQTLNVRPGSLLLLHLNAESLRSKKLKKLQELVSFCRYSPDVICVSDTRDPKFASDFTLPSYSFRQAIPKFVSGGVAIYVKQSLFCKERNDLAFQISDCENAWMEIRRERDGQAVVIGAVHRHSSTMHLKEFIPKMKQVIHRISVMERKVFYILGSINLDLLSTDKKIREYQNDLLKLGCRLLINRSTKRPKTGSATGLLDHVYTNDQFTDESGVIDTSERFSDHYPIYCIA